MVTRRLSDFALSIQELILGVSMVAFGFLVYYVAPYALFNQEIGLFLTIFNVLVMIEVLLGATLIFSILQPYI